MVISVRTEIICLAKKAESKLLLNVWRMIGLIYRVFFCVLREKDEEINEREDYDPLIQSEEEKDDDDDSFTPLLSDDGL